MNIFLGIVVLLVYATIKLGVIFLACSLYDDFKKWRKNRTKAKVVIKGNGDFVDFNGNKYTRSGK